MKRQPCSTISGSESGRVLLDWLAARFSYYSTEEWRRALAEGRVSVDGRPAAPDRLLAKGETVAFDPPPYDEPGVDPRYSIIYEDDDYLILDKSGDLPCHPCGRYFRHSLWYMLRDRYGEVGIATRLDRETSGLVLACRSSAAAAIAEELLRGGKLVKEYLALVHGSFPPRLEAQGSLLPDRDSAVRVKRRFVPEQGSDLPGSRSCSTLFELVASVEPDRRSAAAGSFSLVRALPKSGRTHQIRASLLALGFPIVGDKLYGRDETIFIRQLEGRLSEEDLTRLILPNQALHCSYLGFSTGTGEVRALSLPRWAGPFGIALEAILPRASRS
jgi:RluA family pseudouridine synthase